jgi:hypothetical protein
MWNQVHVHTRQLSSYGGKFYAQNSHLTFIQVQNPTIRSGQMICYVVLGGMIAYIAWAIRKNFEP